jgi:hypothetical protein
MHTSGDKPAAAGGASRGRPHFAPNTTAAASPAQQRGSQPRACCARPLTSHCTRPRPASFLPLPGTLYVSWRGLLFLAASLAESYPIVAKLLPHIPPPA